MGEDGAGGGRAITMSVIDILTRVDVLCKKYEKYDLDKQRAADSVSGHDQFLKLYTLVEADIEASLQVFVCVCMYVWCHHLFGRSTPY